MDFDFRPFVRCFHLLIAATLLIGGLGCDKTQSAAAEKKTDDPAPAVTTSASDGHPGGLYIRQQMVSWFANGRMSFSLQREFFYFFPDGHIVFAIPSGGNVKEHPTAEDYAALKDIAPDLRGTYVVKDGNITFHPDKGKESTEPFSVPVKGDENVLQIGVPSIVGSVKAMPFKDGQKLDGVYTFNGTVGHRTDLTVFNVNTLTFRPDGTLGSDQLTGVDTKGINTAVGNSGVTTHAQTASAGTYHFNGYALETNIDGHAVKATAFRWAGDDKNPEPGMICIAGRLYTHYEAKK